MKIPTRTCVPLLVVFGVFAAFLGPAVVAEEPATEYGLSLEQRQQVFRKSLDAEARAEAEASKRFPQDPETEAASDFTSKILHESQGEIAREYDITRKQRVLIVAEGYAKGWSPSPPHPAEEF